MLDLSLKFKKDLSSYFLLFVSTVMLSLGTLVSFSLDLKDQWPLILIIFLLAGIFFLATFNLQGAFLLSLILLPIFFALENLNVISKTYDISFEQSSYFSLLDLRLLGFIITVILATVTLLRKKERFFSAPLSKIMPFFIGLIFISAFWSIGNQAKYVQFFFFLLLALLYFIAYFSVESINSFYKLIGFIIFISVPAILMGYYQWLGGWLYEYSDLEIKRVTGPFETPNQFGSLLLITSALSLTLLTALKGSIGKIYRNTLWLYLVFTLPIFILTFSRSAWIGLAIFLLIFSLQKKQLTFLTATVGALILIGMLSFATTRERIEGIFQHNMFDSMYARQEVWHLSFEKFKQKPWLGYGAGSFSEVIRDSKESGGGTDNPHNDIVFFSVETGLIGALSFILLTAGFYFYLIKSHFKIKQKTTLIKGGYLQIISLSMISLMIAISTISLVESYYEGNFLYLMFWPLIGSWLAVNLKKSNATYPPAKVD